MKLTYFQAIEECRKDLAKRHQQDLHKLAKHLDIPITDTIDHDLAIALIDQHYPQHKGNMDPAPELPYGGDMQKAMQAQDRDAIRQIMQYRQSQEADRNQRIMKEQESRKLVESAKVCSNDADLISLEDWSETNEPDLKIKYMSITNPFEEIDRIVCYDSQELKRWVDYPTNTFAAWIPNRKQIFQKPNDEGYGKPGSGGFGPSRSQKYIKLPDGNFVQFYNPDDIESQSELVAFPYAKKRVGNIRGTYGVSELHGQAPDKTIYFVYPENHNLQEGIRSLLEEDYTSRFPFAGLAIDQNHSETAKVTFIKFLKDHTPKELTDELKEQYKGCPCNFDTHQLIDDLIPKLWPSIGHNDVLDQSTVTMDMIDTYHKLYKQIGKEKIMEYWIEQVISPYISTLTPSQAHSAILNIHDSVPQETNDYDENMDRIQEQYQYQTESPDPSPEIFSPPDFEELYQDQIINLNQLLASTPIFMDQLQQAINNLNSARVNYYNYLHQTIEISAEIAALTLDETNDKLSQATAELLQRSRIREALLDSYLDGYVPMGMRELERTENNNVVKYKTVLMLQKHLQNLQRQSTSRQLDFGDDDSNPQEEYTTSLNNLIEELRTEDQTDAQVQLDEFEYASNNYYDYISRNPEISQEISSMNLDDVIAEISRINTTLNDNLDKLQEFYELIRHDINLSGNDVDELLMLERSILQLHKELKALEERQRNILQIPVPDIDTDIESDDSQATVLFEPAESMENDSDTESVFDPDEM